MGMSRCQNAGQNNLWIANKLFENVANSKALEQQ
jgi:hypothetical protein